MDFYEKMKKNVAERLVRKRGVAMTYTDLSGAIGTGKVVYVKPDRKRDEDNLQNEYVTDSAQRGAYFFIETGSPIIENGGTITSSGVTRTVRALKPIAPADYLVIYNCLLEV